MVLFEKTGPAIGEGVCEVCSTQNLKVKKSRVDRIAEISTLVPATAARGAPLGTHRSILTHALAARAEARLHANAPLNLAAASAVQSVRWAGRRDTRLPLEIPSGGAKQTPIQELLSPDGAQRRHDRCGRRPWAVRPQSYMDDGRQTAGHVCRAARPADKTQLKVHSAPLRPAQ
jgi:hypothetical protein